jgi:hypothetical protein
MGHSKWSQHFGPSRWDPNDFKTRRPNYDAARAAIEAYEAAKATREWARQSAQSAENNGYDPIRMSWRKRPTSSGADPRVAALRMKIAQVEERMNRATGEAEYTKLKRKRRNIIVVLIALARTKGWSVHRWQALISEGAKKDGDAGQTKKQGPTIEKDTRGSHWASVTASHQSPSRRSSPSTGLRPRALLHANDEG